MSDTEYVVVREYQLEHQAELARVVLEASDIQAVVLRDNAGGMLPVLQIAFPIRVAVPAHQAAEALEILDESEADE